LAYWHFLCQYKFRLKTTTKDTYMAVANAIKRVGVTGSPYTRKMLALLRYRHIPHQIIWGIASEELAEMAIQPPKVELFT
jgi:hypothetical protein